VLRIKRVSLQKSLKRLPEGGDRKAQKNKDKRERWGPAWDVIGKGVELPDNRSFARKKVSKRSSAL